MFYDLKDKKPQNSGENWVAPNATIIGDVTLEKNSSIGLMQYYVAILKIFILAKGPMFKTEASYIPIQVIH